MRFFYQSDGQWRPRGHRTLTLPILYADCNSPDPTLPNQYANWWNGGRIALLTQRLRRATVGCAHRCLQCGEDGRHVPGGSPVPTLSRVVSHPASRLRFFLNPDGLATNDPSQLTEWTLGALGGQPDQSKPQPIDLHTVDYDLSFVDATYMPAAMEPYNNAQVGLSAPTWRSINSGRLCRNFFRRIWVIPSSRTLRGW